MNKCDRYKDEILTEYVRNILLFFKVIFLNSC